MRLFCGLFAGRPFVSTFAEILQVLRAPVG